MNSAVKRIAMVAPTWVGDAVMSLPLVGYLAAAPGVRMTVVSRGYASRVYLGLDGVNDVVILGGGGRLGRIWAQTRLYRRLRIDGVVVLPPSFSSALGPFLAGVGGRSGVRSDGRAGLLNVSLAEEGLREEHLSTTYLKLGRMLLERLEIEAGHSFERPSVVAMKSDREELETALKYAGVGDGDYLVVVPGATYGPTKSWPKEKYKELVRRLSGEMPVVLGGAKGERALCESIADGRSGVFNLAGATSLGQFIALLGGASAVIANDSGSPHIAASMGVPVVVIFGSTSPTWTAPLGRAVQVLRHPVHCSPCFLRECPTQLECYEGIVVSDVFNAALSALEKRIEDGRTN